MLPLPIHYYTSYALSLLTKHFINKKTKELNQKLFCSIRNKNYDEMKEVIHQGADINNAFNPALIFRESALTMVVVRGDLNMVKWLVERGANIDFNNGSALENCVCLDYIEIAHYLIEEGADIKTNKGETIRWLAKKKHFDTLKLILDNPKQCQYAIAILTKLEDKSAVQWAENYSNAGRIYEKLNTELKSTAPTGRVIKI